MKRLRIMLVEDDFQISSLLVELLNDMGHDVCATARTERDAITAAARQAPDVMIVDVFLSEGSGVAAVAEILRHAAIPNIFMTGGLRTNAPPQACVLMKPFGAAALSAALDRMTASATGHGSTASR